MGLLQKDERTTLVNTLLRMSFTNSVGGRNLLLQDLPLELQASISFVNASQDIQNIINAVDGPQADPIPGRGWGIVLVVDNALQNGVGDAKDEILRGLLATLTERNKAFLRGGQAGSDGNETGNSTGGAGMKALNGTERDELAQCLVNAFNPGDLGRLARRVFDMGLDDITSRSNKVDVCNELVEFARAHDQLQALILGARALNTTNIALKAFAERVGAEGGSAGTTGTNGGNGGGAHGESGTVAGNGGQPQSGVTGGGPPPRTTQSKPTSDELDRVRTIIRDNLVIAFNTPQLVQFMKAAGLSSTLIGNFQWANMDPTSIAAQMVDLALQQGKPLVSNRPGANSVLGLILDEVLRRQLVGMDDGQFLATMIGRYNLLDLNTAKVSDSLLALLQITPVAATPAATLELERVVRQSDPFLDVMKWFSDGSRAAQAVCRIVVPLAGGGVSFGTGSLVGPDLVLTNFHVVEDLITGKNNGGVKVDPAVVKVQFGFALDANGQALQQGQTYGLAAGDAWEVDLSAFDKLDYALLRLNGTAGTDMVGDRPRGWLTPRPHTFTQGESLFIIQHPLLGPNAQQSAPLKIVLGSNAIMPPTDNPNRITYATNTEPGSSGSPCFSINWEWIALHHASLGDRNEGIPLGTIAQQPVIKAALAANPAQP